MSELNELIMKSSMHSFESGRKHGRQEVLDLLQKHHDHFSHPSTFNYRAELRKIIEEIKHDQD